MNELAVQGGEREKQIRVDLFVDNVSVVHILLDMGVNQSARQLVL